MKAKQTNDGVYRNIYRPTSQGFVNRTLSSSQVVSAFIIVSSQPDFNIQPVQFQKRDSINVPFGQLKQDFLYSQALQKKSTKKTYFQGINDKINVISGSENNYSKTEKDR